MKKKFLEIQSRRFRTVTFEQGNFLFFFLFRDLLGCLDFWIRRFIFAKEMRCILSEISIFEKSGRKNHHRFANAPIRTISSVKSWFTDRMRFKAAGENRKKIKYFHFQKNWMSFSKKEPAFMMKLALEA